MIERATYFRHAKVRRICIGLGLGDVRLLSRRQSPGAGANKRILVEWTAYGAPTSIEWVFTTRADGTTFVSITNSGFSGSLHDITRTAVAATEGFAFVLAGAKALLEHGVQLNLVPDCFPDGIPKGHE